jgi:hypothetical protein
LLILNERLTHSSLWKIFPRLIRTFTLDLKDFHERVLELRRFDFEGFSQERNRVLYKPYSWSREDNIGISDLDVRVSYAENYNFIYGFNKPAEYYSKYYFIAVAVNNLLDFLIRDLGELAPALTFELETRPGPRAMTTFAMT